MQVPPSSDGIQRLIAAEQEAQRIVGDARKAKQDRLRQAKAEAEKEINAYKAEREMAYQKKIAEGTAGSANNVKRLQTETDAAILKTHSDVTARKGQVVDMLVNFVSTVSYK